MPTNFAGDGVSIYFYRYLLFGVTILVLSIGMAHADQRRGPPMREDGLRRQEMIDRMNERRERLRELREDVQRQAHWPHQLQRSVPPEPRGDEMARSGREVPPGPPPAMRRLSPEERRQLRRDVRDAANEVYRH
ncbi:MAG TPA: hypothetical protein VFW00_12295 [Rhodocyclaceae bacterium]|nr:hypothetical protein [Rhodocyclaceae bacterium]